MSLSRLHRTKERVGSQSRTSFTYQPGIVTGDKPANSVRWGLADTALQT